MDAMTRTFLLGQITTIESQLVALRSMVSLISSSDAPRRVDRVPSKPQMVESEIDQRMGEMFADLTPEIVDPVE
jgi:hypothetical protein